MPETLQYLGTLTIVTCWCGMRHAVPTELREFQIRQFNDGRQVTSIYCPLGHQHQPAGETDAERLRKQLEKKEQQLARERALADQQQARLRDKAKKAENACRAEKAAKTRIKNRIAKGVCPCCNRCFGIGALQRHLETKHPEFVANN